MRRFRGVDASCNHCIMWRRAVKLLQVRSSFGDARHTVSSALADKQQKTPAAPLQLLSPSSGGNNKQSQKHRTTVTFECVYLPLEWRPKENWIVRKTWCVFSVLLSHWCKDYLLSVTRCDASANVISEQQGPWLQTILMPSSLGLSTEFLSPDLSCPLSSCL